MRITVNQSEVELEHPAVLLDFVAGYLGRELTADGCAADGGRLGVALARNGEVVPRRSWALTELAESDRIDVVTAVQGG